MAREAWVKGDQRSSCEAGSKTLEAGRCEPYPHSGDQAGGMNGQLAGPRRSGGRHRFGFELLLLVLAQQIHVQVARALDPVFVDLGRQGSD